MARILLTADWHLRGDAPSCRANPQKWLEDQRHSVEQLYAVVKEERCSELWVVGDLFHRSATATEATNQALALLQGFGELIVRVLAGNHDLRYHTAANLVKSTIGAVFSLANVKELESHEQPFSMEPSDARALRIEAYPFGTEPEQIPSCDIWCTHQLVFPDEASRPLPELGVLAEELLERSDAKVIITGDYHHGYVKEFGDRKVVTCGCLNIQARDMADYMPRAYILDTATFDVKEVPLKTFGELDVEAPMLEDANGYAESIKLAELPRIDFRAAVDAAAQRAGIEVQDKVHEILESYDTSVIS